MKQIPKKKDLRNPGDKASKEGVFNSFVRKLSAKHGGSLQSPMNHMKKIEASPSGASSGQMKLKQPTQAQQYGNYRRGNGKASPSPVNAYGSKKNSINSKNLYPMYHPLRTSSRKRNKQEGSKTVLMKSSEKYRI